MSGIVLGKQNAGMKSWSDLFVVALLVVSVAVVVVAHGGSPASRTVRQFLQTRKTVENHRFVEHNFTPLKHIRAAPRNADIVWSRHSNFGIYESCDVSAATQHVFAGTTAVHTPTDPDDAELIPFSKGTPDWVYTAPNVQVAVQRNGDVLAACSWDDEQLSLNCSKWTAGKGATPDYSILIPDSFPTETTLAVSKDGKRLAILSSVLEFMNPNNTRAYILGTGSPKILTKIEEVFGARHCVLNGDGSRIVFHANASIFAFDTVTGRKIQEIKVGYSDYNLAMSDDGDYLISGFMSLDVYKWSTSTNQYELMWNAVNPSHYVETSTISANGNLAVAWASFDAEQPTIQAYNVAKGSTPLWTYQYAESTNLQDIPSSIGITDDGNYFVVGSWGNLTDSNPEARVWNFYKEEPIWTLKTSGSVFAVDIAASASKPGTLDVVVGNKATHANVMGRGGDLYYANIKTA